MDCIFCKIIKGEIKSEILYETNDFIVINDISHMANKHYLIIPKKHFAYLNEVDEEKSKIIANIMLNMNDIEKALKLEEGYRLVINQRSNAGQTVNHLHMHILGGEKLSDKFN
ncbi:MAG: HIT domain-containing protein [Clostridiales bacterium]|nr:HIT domain-containing protein [Clostridiales bacterium]